MRARVGTWAMGRSGNVFEFAEELCAIRVCQDDRIVINICLKNILQDARCVGNCVGHNLCVFNSRGSSCQDLRAGQCSTNMRLCLHYFPLQMRNAFLESTINYSDALAHIFYNLFST